MMVTRLTQRQTRYAVNSRRGGKSASTIARELKVTPRRIQQLYSEFCRTGRIHMPLRPGRYKSPPASDPNACLTEKNESNCHIIESYATEQPPCNAVLAGSLSVSRRTCSRFCCIRAWSRPTTGRAQPEAVGDIAEDQALAEDCRGHEEDVWRPDYMHHGMACKGAEHIPDDPKEAAWDDGGCMCRCI